MNFISSSVWSISSARSRFIFRSSSPSGFLNMPFSVSNSFTCFHDSEVSCCWPLQLFRKASKNTFRLRWLLLVSRVFWFTSQKKKFR